MPEKSHQGLVLRDVKVTRGGKTFTQKRWVKAGEDEPAPKKGKKIEDDKSKESYKIGEQFNFLGKDLTIEKVSESQKTVKLSNRKVYTFEAIEFGKRGISGGKYNIGDEVNFNNKKHKIVRINDTVNVVEFEDGTRHSFDDLETFSEKKPEPKKEIKIKDLKPQKKIPEKPKIISEVKVAIKTKSTDVITGSAKDGSLSAKDRKNADKQIQEFVKNLKSEEDKIRIDKSDSVSYAAKAYTCGISFAINAYLLSDRKKSYDYETRGVKDFEDNEKEWNEKKCQLLDEFLDKAPKVNTTSYRGMHWDMDNPIEKKLYDKFISEISEGNIIKSKSYTSTTVNSGILKHYSETSEKNAITAKIEYKTKGGVYMASESQSPEQQEVLLPHGMKFKIIEVGKMRGGNINIKMQEVD